MLIFSVPCCIEMLTHIMILGVYNVKCTWLLTNIWVKFPNMHYTCTICAASTYTQSKAPCQVMTPVTAYVQGQ